MSEQIGHSFDVATVLGLGTPDPTPLPKAVEGEIILRVSEPLLLAVLLDSAVGKRLMKFPHSYYKYDWCRQAHPPAINALYIPMPTSYGETFDRQKGLLAKDEKAAPLVLVGAALLCLRKLGHLDPLGEKWTRVAEPTAVGYGVVLGWVAGRLTVDGHWKNNKNKHIGLSSIRISEPCRSSS